MDTDKLLSAVERIGISAVFAFAAAFALFKVFLIMLRSHMDMLGAIRRNLLLNTRVLEEIRRDCKWLRQTGKAARRSSGKAGKSKVKEATAGCKKPAAASFRSRRKGS